MGGIHKACVSGWNTTEYAGRLDKTTGLLVGYMMYDIYNIYTCSEYVRNETKRKPSCFQMNLSVWAASKTIASRYADLFS